VCWRNGRRGGKLVGKGKGDEFMFKNAKGV
jgi:hypothetical protein